MNTNNQGLALLRNLTSPGQRRPQNETENHFDTERSGRFVTMPKSVGISLGRADRAVTSSKHLHLNKQQQTRSSTSLHKFALFIYRHECLFLLCLERNWLEPFPHFIC